MPTAGQGDTGSFLDALFGYKRDEDWILIWRSDTKRSAWAASVEESSKSISPGEPNVYCGVGLSPKSFGPHKRCPAKSISAIVGLWADVDILGPAHSNDKLPPDEQAARSVIDATGLNPSVIVGSGHGLQAWWLFPEPYTIESDSERLRTMAIAASWQESLYAIAVQMGYEIDQTKDIARVLRVPGTTNRKPDLEDVPVKLLTISDSRYSDFADFESVLREADTEKKAKGKKRWRSGIMGVAAGMRNETAASFAGKLASTCGNPFDGDTKAVHWANMLNWNRGNSPPLDEAELYKVFESVWTKEESRRIEENLEALPDKKLGPIYTNGRSKIPEGRKWHLAIVMSKPKEFRLYSHLWQHQTPKGYITLTSAQIASWDQVKKQAIEQASPQPDIDDPELRKSWHSTTQRKGMFARLMETAEVIESPAEIHRDLIVADWLQTRIDRALQLDEGKEPTASGRPCRLPDGSVVFVFSAIWGDARNGPDRITRNEMSCVLQQVGASERSWHKKRYVLLTTEAQQRLYELKPMVPSEGDEQ